VTNENCVARRSKKEQRPTGRRISEEVELIDWIRKVEGRIQWPFVDMEINNGCKWIMNFLTL
jgi:hypothetical protein